MQRIMLALITLFIQLAENTLFAATHPIPDFNQFPVETIHQSRIVLPRFNDREQAFRLYRTVLTREMKLGANFAGNYRVITIGCGTSCATAYIADLKTGKIYLFPRGHSDNSGLQFVQHLSSRLLLAQWADMDHNSCIQEYFDWNGQTAKLIYKHKVGDIDSCYKIVG